MVDFKGLWIFVLTIDPNRCTMVQRYKCVLSETYFKINELKRLAWSTNNLEYINNLKRNIKEKKEEEEKEGKV